MLVPFSALENNSRIWIYQSNKKLSESEKEFIRSKTESFLTEWTAHGDSLQAGMDVLHDQFIIIGVNENVNEASGCSIDRSVSHIRELGKELNLDLLERSKVAIKEKTQIRLVNFSDLKNLISEGQIFKDTEVFNNAIETKSELDSSWIQPADQSWLKRYF